MLTEAQIAEAKRTIIYTHSDPLHEHDDCVRIASEWLSAQTQTAGTMRKRYAMKHLIEKWGGRYVSQSDVELAAHILRLRGKYPHFNISARLTEPAKSRLSGIGEAFSHDYHKHHDPTAYANREAP